MGHVSNVCQSSELGGLRGTVTDSGTSNVGLSGSSGMVSGSADAPSARPGVDSEAGFGVDSEAGVGTGVSIVAFMGLMMDG